MTDPAISPGSVPTLTGDEVDVVAARGNLLARLILKVVVMFVVLSVLTLSVEGRVAVMVKGLAGAGATVLWVQEVAGRVMTVGPDRVVKADTVQDVFPLELTLAAQLYEVNTKTATDMIFNARSGSNQMVTLADSGATGCLMAQDMAERLGLHIRPWEHGTKGFTCANEGIIGINGTATLPFSIQRYKAKFLKAGANHIMVNIRDSRPVDYPASNVSATETADLLTKAVPSSVHLPNPPEVEVDFETWVKENCPEHGDPALMPAHVVRYLLRKFKKVFNALPMELRSIGIFLMLSRLRKTRYYQIRISDEDAPKTAFTTPMGQYEFKVLGMGLANAPATFQAVINKIFAPYLHKFVVVYLDDILVYGRNPEEHAANLEKVLQVLQDEEFYAKLSKCTFNQSEIKFLGHIIGRNGVKVNPKK
eukprot:gene1724-biopygen14554